VKSVVAHTAAGGGREVTLLLGGTSVTQIAEHEGSILVLFADPRNPSNLEMGWIPLAALERKPSLPCPHGQVSYLNPLGAFCATPCRDSRHCGPNETCVPAGLAAMRRGAITNFLTYCVSK
jgi:hypothetical protein